MTSGSTLNCRPKVKPGARAIKRDHELSETYHAEIPSDAGPRVTSEALARHRLTVEFGDFVEAIDVCEKPIGFLPYVGENGLRPEPLESELETFETDLLAGHGRCLTSSATEGTTL